MSLMKSKVPAARARTATLHGAFCFLAVFLAASALCDTSDRGADRIRLGFSYSMLAGMNENDAKAAMKAFASEISRERSIPADPEPRMLSGTDEIAAAVKSRAVNSIGLSAEEYWILRDQFPFETFLFAAGGYDPMDQYLVLVPANSTARSIADLKGQEIAVLTGPRMSLATIWLNVELAKLGLPPASGFFARRVESIKPSKVVLPVFFGRMNVCIVNRRAFDTMVELNPQIGRQVRTVATSPAYTAAFFGFTGLTPEFRARATREFNMLHESPAGLQVLTMFQTAKVETGSDALIQSAMELLDTHARLCPASNAARIAALRKTSVLPAEMQ